MDNETSIPDLLTIDQFCDVHKAFNPGGIRWQIFNEKTNGLSKSGAIIRVGRRVYINPINYFTWIEMQQSDPASI